MMQRLLVVACLLSFGLALGAVEAPALSDLRHAQAETLSARYDAADAKLKAAQAEMERVKQDVQRFLEATKVEGYTLDLNTLTYAKAEKP